MASMFLLFFLLSEWALCSEESWLEKKERFNHLPLHVDQSKEHFFDIVDAIILVLILLV